MLWQDGKGAEIAGTKFLIGVLDMQQHATCHVTEHILYLYFPVVVLVLTIPFPLGIQQYIFNLNFKFCFGAELLFAIIEVLSSP